MRASVLVILVAMAIACLSASGCARHAQSVPPSATDFDAIVIGAGMGGLSAGAHLATGGMKVLVLEQHHKVGGCTSSFQRGDYRFDTALHEMAGGAPGTPLGDLLARAGVANRIELIPIPNLYRSIFPGVEFTMPAERDAAVRALCARWPAECEGVERFHDLMRRIHEDAMSLGEMYRIGGRRMAWTLLRAPVRQHTLFRYYLTPLQKVLDEHFRDPGLQGVVGQFWVYYGPPPSRLWTPIFMAANHTYLTDGPWHVRGSSQALADAYAARIVELGGVVRTGERVTRIRVEDGRATGVVTERGETFTARYVVSNADPFQTFFRLVGEEKTPKKLARRIRSMKPSNSLVGVYLGLDVPPSFWNATDHEVFYNASLDPDENYRNMMEGRYDHAAVALTFYTNLGDPWYSPPGTSVLVLHAYSKAAIWPEERVAYERKKAEVTAQLVGLAERVYPGLSAHIVVSETITPRTLEAFTLQHDGIPYGWDFTVDQGLRLTNRTPIEGLYLAGSWTNPGHGVGTAQISGYQAARLILDREGVN